MCWCVLQGALAPVLLRRMKEDVEDLPEKEEVVIWVELTAEQRRCDRAVGSVHKQAKASRRRKPSPGTRTCARQ